MDWPFPDESRQPDPFGFDPTTTIEEHELIEDPTEGIALSYEWHNPDELEVCPVLDPRAVRWQESAFYQSASGKFQQYTCMELARFFVPNGSQGRISRIETSILTLTDVTPVEVDGGISPAAYVLAYGGWPTNVIRFYLRLDSWRQGQGLPGAPEIFTDQSCLPGVAHPELGMWYGSIYDFARRDNLVAINVPEGHVVRMFGQMVAPPRGDYPALVWGRLAGQTQTYHNNIDSIVNARAWLGR